jgi:hypothetical protein
VSDEAYDHVDPYADGTYGTNYTPASAELEHDTHEEIMRQHAIVWELARKSGTYGITGADVQLATGWETNACSRCLSNLLRDGGLVRLSERRRRAHIHVLPAYADHRELLPYKSSASKQRVAALREAHDIVAGSGSYYEALTALDELIAREES